MDKGINTRLMSGGEEGRAYQPRIVTKVRMISYGWTDGQMKGQASSPVS